jgi:hypothetical protein
MGRPKRAISVTIPLSPEDEAWLKGECQRLGGDIPNLCQIIIRSRPVILGVGTINSENGTSDAPERAKPAGLSPTIGQLQAATGLDGTGLHSLFELSAEEISVARSTIGLQPYLARIESHTAAVEARLARGALNGAMPAVQQLDRLAAERTAKLDGAA